MEKRYVFIVDEFIFKFRNNFAKFLLHCICFTLISYIAIKIIVPEEFSTLLVIKSGSIDPSDSSFGGGILTKKSNESKTLSDEALNFISNKFFKNPTYSENPNKNSWIVKIDNTDNADLINITLSCFELKFCKEFAKKIVAETKLHFKQRISGLINLKLAEVKKYEIIVNSLNLKSRELSEIEKSLGTNITLIAEQNRIQTQIIELENKINSIKGDLIGSKLRDFSTVIFRPNSLSPIWPKASSTAIFLGIIYGLIYILTICFNSIKEIELKRSGDEHQNTSILTFKKSI